MKSIANPLTEFAMAAAEVISQQDDMKQARARYYAAVQEWFAGAAFTQADVLSATADPAFQLATNKLYREFVNTKRLLANAKRRLDTRYRKLPMEFKGRAA